MTMADKGWSNYLVLSIATVLVAGGVYYVAQTRVDWNRYNLPILAYIECLRRASTIDWSKYEMGDTKPPSASEICENRKP